MKKALLITVLVGAVLLTACSPAAQAEQSTEQVQNDYALQEQEQEVDRPQRLDNSKPEGRLAEQQLQGQDRPERGKTGPQNDGRGRPGRNDRSNSIPRGNEPRMPIERLAELLGLQEQDLVDRIEAGETIEEIAESLGIELPFEGFRNAPLFCQEEKNEECTCE